MLLLAGMAGSVAAPDKADGCVKGATEAAGAAAAGADAEPLVSLVAVVGLEARIEAGVTEDSPCILLRRALVRSKPGASAEAATRRLRLCRTGAVSKACVTCTVTRRGWFVWHMPLFGQAVKHCIVSDLTEEINIWYHGKPTSAHT